MNRRGFLTFLSAGAVAAVAPSQVWPFTKIFLPPAPTLVPLMLGPGLDPDAMLAQLSLNSIQACKLEAFAKGIPSLFFHKNAVYNCLTKSNRIETRPTFRIPQQMRLANGSTILFDPVDNDPYRAESAVAASEVLSAFDRDIRVKLTI